MRRWLLAAFRAWGRGHARKLARSGLDGVFVEGLSPVSDALREGPVIFAANHVSWWDGLLVVMLNARLAADGWVLMDAKRLREHSFFAAFGAIPIGESVRQELARAAGALDGPGRALWIFPQGQQRPEWTRPLGFRPGVAMLARCSGARVVPVALRYWMRESPRPRALIRFGAPMERPDAAAVEAQVAALLDAPIPEDAAEALVLPRPDSPTATRALAWLYDRLIGA